MKQTFQALSSIVVILVLASGSLAGCGDSESSGFSADCSICVNDTPVGPSADMASCSAWGALFDCTSAVLENEGMCGDTAAACQVAECATEPTGCSLEE